MSEVKTYFVLPTNSSDIQETSEFMQQAYDICKQNKVNVQLIREDEVLSNDYNRTDVMVFQHFDGDCFDAMKEKNCIRIISPLVLSECLTKGDPIPNFDWPIFNMAMAGCVLCCTSIPKDKRMDVKEKIKLMGGCIKDNFSPLVTHLVSGSAKSQKYEQAGQRDCKIMSPEWVDNVWQVSQTTFVHCEDAQFDKYRCLPFHNLIICATGVPDEMRNDLREKIRTNGGVFTNNMVIAKTDVLIVHGPAGAASAKYKAARRNRLVCVNINWVFDSIKRGYALPEGPYGIKRQTSTPTKCDETNPNFSTISAISSNENPVQVEDTMCNAGTVSTVRVSPLNRKRNNFDELIDGLDIKKAKRSGQFLDGCSVFLAGFTLDQRDKLSKILNCSGATRYDDISDRVTHIIIGDTSCPEAKFIRNRNNSACLVSVHWLLESLEKKHPVDEEDFLINFNDSGKEQFSSPLGRKGLNLLRSHNVTSKSELETAKQIQKVGSIQQQNEDNMIMAHYSQQSRNDEEDDTIARLLNEVSSMKMLPQHTDTIIASQTSSLSQNVQLFYGRTFVLKKFAGEEFEVLSKQIEDSFGRVMPKTYNGIADYIVTPICINESIQDSAMEVVNQLWIIDCLAKDEICDVLYYHRPIILNGNRCLQNCVVTISNYNGRERDYLENLIKSLGGIFQNQFAKIAIPSNNIWAATHLICSQPEGKKYLGAVKWGLPAVTKDWLIECANAGRLVKEDKYLVGASSVSSKSKENNCKSINDEMPTPSSSKSKSKVLTPLTNKCQLNSSANTSTPKMIKNRFLQLDGFETPTSNSQPTVNKIIAEARRNNLLDAPATPAPIKTSVDTPEGKFGVLFSPNLSKEMKKDIQQMLNRLPPYHPPRSSQRRKSTPLSEVKRRALKKLLGEEEPEEDERVAENSNSSVRVDDDEEVEQEETAAFSYTDEGPNTSIASRTSAEQEAVELDLQMKLKELEEYGRKSMEARRRSAVVQKIHIVHNLDEEEVETQTMTVGWDYSNDDRSAPKEKTRIIMLSGIDTDVRQAMVEKIESLGGQVSELSSYDPKCTHLICPKTARNEKALSSMAAGKWVLHESYVDRCVEAGQFLPEDEFEFGNPKFYETFPTKFDEATRARMDANYWWRRQITRRGYGAFYDVRAIVVAEKREMIVRVIEAGGGKVYDLKPPFDESVHLTHCFLETKSVPDVSAYRCLALRGIYCLNTQYIGEFLFRTAKDLRSSILPQFSSLYI